MAQKSKTSKTAESAVHWLLIVALFFTCLLLIFNRVGQEELSIQNERVQNEVIELRQELEESDHQRELYLRWVACLIMEEQHAKCDQYEDAVEQFQE